MLSVISYKTADVMPRTALSALSLALHWFHLLGVVTWIGGLIFSLFVLTPNLSLLEPKQRMLISPKVIRTFLRLVWLSVGVIVITGFFRVFVVNGMLTLGSFLQTGYGHVLTTKMILVALMIFVATRITWNVVPAVTKHFDEHLAAPPGNEGCSTCAKLQKRIRHLISVALTLGVIVILLAAYLRGA